MERNPLPLLGQAVGQHGIRTLGDAMLGAAGHRHVPQVLLLVVLIEHENVVFELLAGLLCVGLGIGGAEVDGCAIGRPLDVGNRGRVRGERPRFAGGRDPVDLGDRIRFGAAFGDECDALPVGRPARAVLAIGSAGHLRQAGAVGVDPPDMADALAGLPIRNRFDKTIWRPSGESCGSFTCGRSMMSTRVMGRGAWAINAQPLAAHRSIPRFSKISA